MQGGNEMRHVSDAAADEKDLTQMGITSGQAHTKSKKTQSGQSVGYDAPEDYGNLDEMVTDPISHGESRSRDGRGESESLEVMRSPQRPSDVEMQDTITPDEQDEPETTTSKPTAQVSRVATEVYTLSYLVFFAIFGTIARLGLQALTLYPGAPVSFGVLWANEWGMPNYHREIIKARRRGEQADDGAASSDLKTIPLYIGLSTGFCGSFTSFSSFIRDVFLAMVNDLPRAGGATPEPRTGGQSFMAMMAIIIATVALSLSALIFGAHLAIALEGITPSIPYLLGRKVMDRCAVLFGWGAWLGAVLLAIWPPHDAWRGRVIFSIVFAPLGCLARFYASLMLNARVPAFPMGTFAVNIAGVAVLGMCWDLAHAGLGSVIGCQVLQGVEDGFCGCLTTVSTWVAELTALRRRHAYIYGLGSVVVGFAVMVIIMGAEKWTDGFAPLMCTH
ncbi:hypothetical protein HER10_EVM0002108 [Colletotrichum scovillei]|uniref:uncharacterized protein n=1 Tax=Colletotrichum scovillei TaxID=1209932 RepID=UPI0015C35295|nr:uncharacterized protein HER10_EVM0002108 [Colletotrichum scovillei]KAF4774658.1 hypothetical protein HER10_EVM0002108 [Colletotrichum scovillei]